MERLGSWCPGATHESDAPGSGPCWRRYRRSRFGLQQGGAPFGLQKRGKNASPTPFATPSPSCCSWQ
ncbi:hypothetical protein [Azospirillum melinis]